MRRMFAKNPQCQAFLSTPFRLRNLSGHTQFRNKGMICTQPQLLKQLTDLLLLVKSADVECQGNAFSALSFNRNNSNEGGTLDCQGTKGFCGTENKNRQNFCSEKQRIPVNNPENYYGDKAGFYKTSKRANARNGAVYVLNTFGLHPYELVLIDEAFYRCLAILENSQRKVEGSNPTAIAMLILHHPPYLLNSYTRFSKQNKASIELKTKPASGNSQCDRGICGMGMHGYGPCLLFGRGGKPSEHVEAHIHDENLRMAESRRNNGAEVSKKNIGKDLDLTGNLSNLETRSCAEHMFIRRFSGGGTVVLDENSACCSTLILPRQMLPHTPPFPREIMKIAYHFYRGSLHTLLQKQSKERTQSAPNRTGQLSQAVKDTAPKPGSNATVAQVGRKGATVSATELSWDRLDSSPFTDEFVLQDDDFVVRVKEFCGQECSKIVGDGMDRSSFDSKNVRKLNLNSQCINSSKDCDLQFMGVESGLHKGKDCDYAYMKFGGNAQAISRTHFMQHTSFLFDWNKLKIGNLLRMPARQPQYRQRRKHENFVTNTQNALKGYQNEFKESAQFVRKNEDSLIAMEDFIIRIMKLAKSTFKNINLKESNDDFCGQEGINWRVINAVYTPPGVCIPDSFFKRTKKLNYGVGIFQTNESSKESFVRFSHELIQEAIGLIWKTNGNSASSINGYNNPESVNGFLNRSEDSNVKLDRKQDIKNTSCGERQGCGTQLIDFFGEIIDANYFSDILHVNKIVPLKNQ